MKNVLRVLLPLIVLALGVGGARVLVGMRPEVRPTSPELTPPSVESTVARAESVRLHVRAHGTVVPRTESRLASEVAGRVQSVAPSWVEGGFFEAGDALVEIDATDYVLAEKESDQRVAQAALRVEQEEADAAVALEDWRTMHGEEEAPALVLREPQLREARAALEAARAMQKKARRDVERCRIVAPYAGRVRSRGVDVGAFVQPGFELGRIYGTDAVEVRLPLPDAELAFLDLPLSWSGEENSADGAGSSLPQVTLVTRFAGREHTWEGRVVRTEAELAPESRMVVAVCRVPDPYGRAERTDRPPLAPGMFVEATIDGIEVEDAVVLPRSALRSGGRVHVEADGRLSIREVDVLRSERDRVLLRAGVEPGERVVLTPLETAVDGMRVRSGDGR
jgi:RND family efflux transporter MFP subunit